MSCVYCSFVLLNRHRHLPRPIFKASALMCVMADAKRRKEEKRKAHSAPGSITTQPLRRRRIIKEVEWGFSEPVSKKNKQIFISYYGDEELSKILMSACFSWNVPPMKVPPYSVDFLGKWMYRAYNFMPGWLSCMFSMAPYIMYVADWSNEVIFMWFFFWVQFTPNSRIFCLFLNVVSPFPWKPLRQLIVIF